MALVSCPECGRDRVSDSASACPECGFNVKEFYRNKNGNIPNEEERFGKSVGEKTKEKNRKQNASTKFYDRLNQENSQSSAFENGRNIGRNLAKLFANNPDKFN